MPALQPVVSRRAHDVGGEIPAACGAAEQAAGPRRSLEDTTLEFRRDWAWADFLEQIEI